jgi:hypothetical protein
MKEKLKISVIIAVMCAIIVGSIYIYFSSLWELKKKKPSRIKNPETKEMLEIESLQNEMRQIKTIIADKNLMAEPKQERVQIVVKDEFSSILLTLIFIEKKLNNGGEIINDVIKLKALTRQMPEIYNVISSFENVTKLSSKEDLLTGFTSYVKLVKSDEIKEKGGMLNNIKAFVVKYFAVLNINNERDKTLLEIEQCLKIENYICAFNFSFHFKEKNDFTSSLEASSKVKEGTNAIYLIIGEKL